MSNAPRILKPFVPSGEDWDAAHEFFARLGFTKVWANDDIAELAWGEAVFLLQRFHNQEMQQNLMLDVTVPDLDAFWEHVQESGALDLPGARGREPTVFPWGDREVHLIDPAGVCWHFRAIGD